MGLPVEHETLGQSVALVAFPEAHETQNVIPSSPTQVPQVVPSGCFAHAQETSACAAGDMNNGTMTMQANSDPKKRLLSSFILLPLSVTSVFVDLALVAAGCHTIAALDALIIVGLTYLCMALRRCGCGPERVAAR
jgi:hypothetical protein